MKKILSGIIATTMVASMSVTAFAKTDKIAMDKNADIYEKNFDEDFALLPQYGKVSGAFDNDGNEIKGEDLSGGEKIYYPILFLDEDTGNYQFATRHSEIDDLSVRIDEDYGSRYIEGAHIEKENIEKLTYNRSYLKSDANDDDKVGTSIYCVAVEISDYFGKKEEQDIEFQLQLRKRGRNVFDTDDYKNAPQTSFVMGNEAEEPSESKNDENSPTGYGARMRHNTLEFKINDNTRRVSLDEYGKEDVDEVFIEGGDIDFNFSARCSNQDPLYLQVNRKPDKDVLRKYERYDLEFINFPGNPTFDFTGDFTYTVDDDDEDYYIYEIKNGKLSEIKTNYKYDDGEIIFRTRTLGSYVISEGKRIKLNNDKPVTEVKKENDITVGATKNQPTTKPTTTNNTTTTTNIGGKPNFESGDNSMLSIASAMAIISGISMLAVTRKKNK